MDNCNNVHIHPLQRLNNVFICYSGVSPPEDTIESIVAEGGFLGYSRYCAREIGAPISIEVTHSSVVPIAVIGAGAATATGQEEVLPSVQ